MITKLKLHRRLLCAGLVGLIGLWTAAGAVYVDVAPGTGAPPGTLGGYLMGAFPADTSIEGTPTVSLEPPPTFEGSGNLGFDAALDHYLVGSGWATWSHGYTGSVYYNTDNNLLITLPTGTMAFYLYVEPNIRGVFEFKVDSMATVATLDIDGDAGARYVGFYSDDPMYPLQFIYVDQTTQESDGFGVGEFGINVVPEPGAFGTVLGTLALGLGAVYRRQRR